MAAKPELKLVTTDASARASLAAAHATAAAAAKSVAEAERANDNALERLGAVSREHEELTWTHRDVSRNAASAVMAANEGRRLIEALANGGDIEPPAPQVDRLGEVTRQLADTEIEISKWRSVRRAIEGEIADRQSALEAARRDVDKAARAVCVANVNDVEAVIDATSANLAVLFQLNLLSPGDARIYRFFHGVTIMDQAEALRHPAAQRLRDHLAALMRDAEAAF